MSVSSSEEWKQIVGHPDYEVSSLGRVRSNKRWPSIILKERYDRYGHARLDLDGKTLKVHQLVANAFIPLPSWHHDCNTAEDLLCLCSMEPQCVRHLDDDKQNNAVSNLAWGTYSQNLIDSYKNGRRPSKKHSK